MPRLLTCNRFKTWEIGCKLENWGLCGRIWSFKTRLPQTKSQAIRRCNFVCGHTWFASFMLTYSLSPKFLLTYFLSVILASKTKTVINNFSEAVLHTLVALITSTPFKPVLHTLKVWSLFRLYVLSWACRLLSSCLDNRCTFYSAQILKTITFCPPWASGIDPFNAAPFSCAPAKASPGFAVTGLPFLNMAWDSSWRITNWVNPGGPSLLQWV